ncbi:MAG: 7TM diverse intracellular signaling domain-containing protein [Flavobacteriales bacterium]
MKSITLCGMLSIACSSFAQITITESGLAKNVGRHFQILEDSLNTMDVAKAMASEDYISSSSDVPNMQLSGSSFWLRIPVTNNSGKSQLCIDLRQPNLDEVEFYEPTQNGYNVTKTGDHQPIAERAYKHQNYVFPIELETGSSKTYFLKVKSSDQIQLPLSIGTESELSIEHNNRDILFGIFAGIMLALILYNLFIWIKTREWIYGLYILYLAIIFATQTNVLGFSYRFLWPHNPWLERHAVILLISLSGIVGIIFIRYYLKADTYVKWSKYVFYSAIAVYATAAIISNFNLSNLPFKMVEINGSLIAIAIVVIAILCWRRGSLQAANMLLAWATFLAGLFIFVMKDFGVLPYNEFTVHTMTIGSALEGILLSFGLADKINQLKKEKEEAQLREVEMMKNNEAMLTRKVQERTHELEDAKDELQRNYDHLRLTQRQLVESEKMSGLGQMTAGIAHELNNPINFVSSNITPLNRDVEQVIAFMKEFEQLPEDVSAEQLAQLKKKYHDADMPYVKQEIDMLMKGIHEGARRTAEIVKGLRIFARADRDALVKANINECMDATLIVMKSALKEEVTLEKELDTTLPMLDCFPGKLNQAFVNIISNAVHATRAEGRTKADRHVRVKTWADDKNLYVSVKDNGKGMSEEVRLRMFEPFYTTKGVGEGTGLGLSITLGILEEHNGQVHVNTSPHTGTEIIIEIPRNLSQLRAQAA